MSTDALNNAETRMKKAVEALRRDLNTIRTGRAQPALVEHLLIEYYGVPTPLNQIASINVSDARQLTIQPWDRQSLGTIEKGILKSDLALVPNNDGTVIRINIPTLTEERRRELVRLVKKKVEDARVAVRGVRRDAVERLREMEKSKDLSQDDDKRAQDQLQKLTDVYISQMDTLSKGKEAEVMEV
ncbi:MAG: ribosome recycling factor [Chloroflexi bacterium]|nr:ribosome recycling factor [Chloroflexota bacterium]